MKKIPVSKEKIDYIFRLIILLITFLIIIANLFILKNNLDANSNIRQTRAEIISVTYQKNNEQYLLKYTIDNKEYQDTTSLNSHKYEVGDEVTIFYKKNDPTKIVKKKNLLFPIIILILGIFAIIYEIILTFRNFKDANSLEKLIEKGIVLNTTIEDIFVTSQKNQFKLRTSYFNPVDQKKYVYISESFSKEFKDYLTTNKIKEVKVYLNKENTNKYYVDINSLRKD